MNKGEMVSKFMEKDIFYVKDWNCLIPISNKIITLYGNKQEHDQITDLREIITNLNIDLLEVEVFKFLNWYYDDMKHENCGDCETTLRFSADYVERASGYYLCHSCNAEHDLSHINISDMTYKLEEVKNYIELIKFETLNDLQLTAIDNLVIACDSLEQMHTEKVYGNKLKEEE